MGRWRNWSFLLLLVIASMVLEAKTPYQRGYADGCQSARKGIIVKQIRLFKNNVNYRNGWFAGKKACRPKSAVWTYRKGYSDGCSSRRGVWRKNLNAYRRFRAYRNGWIAGKRNCGVKRISSPASGAEAPRQ